MIAYTNPGADPTFLFPLRLARQNLHHKSPGCSASSVPMSLQMEWHVNLPTPTVLNFPVLLVAIQCLLIQKIKVVSLFRGKEQTMDCVSARGMLYSLRSPIDQSTAYLLPLIHRAW